MKSHEWEFSTNNDLKPIPTVGGNMAYAFLQHDKEIKGFYRDPQGGWNHHSWSLSGKSITKYGRGLDFALSENTDTPMVA